MRSRHEFGVTIASNLSLAQVADVGKFNQAHVLDLRFCEANQPRPIEEVILKRLSNIRVGYEQMPLDTKAMSRRQENQLFNMLCEQRGNILVLTDQVAGVANFCAELDIPYLSTELYLVETGAGTKPVQVEYEQEIAQKLAMVAVNRVG